MNPFFSRLRYILPISTVMAGILGSCSSDSVPDTPQSQEEMKFEIAGDSRTVATTNNNIKDNPFMLFGDVNLNGTTLKTIFDWHSVQYKNNIWDYGTVKQYWFMGQEHSFVAIHPFIKEDDSQVKILTYENNKLSFIYVLPEKLEDAKDLLFATHRRKFTIDNSGPVKFQFTHLLTRINIALALIEDELMYDYVDEKATQNKNEYIKVHSVQFIGVKTTASFNFYPVPLNSTTYSTYDYKMDYLVDNSVVNDLTVILEGPSKVPNSYKDGADKQEIKYVSALNDNEIIVMLPQTFASQSESKMIVNYSINDDIDDLRKLIIPLKDTSWKEGTTYTYKLLIDDVYYGHVKKGTVTIDVDDSRITGENGDDSWYFDDGDTDHNIWFGYYGDGTEHNGKKE